MKYENAIVWVGLVLAMGAAKPALAGQQTRKPAALNEYSALMSCKTGADYFIEVIRACVDAKTVATNTALDQQDHLQQPTSIDWAPSKITSSYDSTEDMIPATAQDGFYVLTDTGVYFGKLPDKASRTGTDTVGAYSAYDVKIVAPPGHTSYLEYIKRVDSKTGLESNYGTQITTDAKEARDMIADPKLSFTTVNVTQAPSNPAEQAFTTAASGRLAQLKRWLASVPVTYTADHKCFDSYADPTPELAGCSSADPADTSAILSAFAAMNSVGHPSGGGQTSGSQGGASQGAMPASQ